MLLHDDPALTDIAILPPPVTRQRNAYLAELEAESIFILREVAAECRNIALLFSGGKDSAVVLRLAQKAFFPEKAPVTLLHIDTEQNFPEVIAFRDRMARDTGPAPTLRSPPSAPGCAGSFRRRTWACGRRHRSRSVPGRRR